MMTYTATQAGEWPTGIYWTPGEIRTLPANYPVTSAPPAWLVDASATAPAAVASVAKAPPGKAKK